MNVRLPADLRARIAQDASDQEVSVNDVIVGILADEFKVRFEGTGRKSPGVHKDGDGTVILRRVPIALYRKIVIAAIGRSHNEVVETTLRSHYKLDTAEVAA